MTTTLFHNPKTFNQVQEVNGVTWRDSIPWILDGLTLAQSSQPLYTIPGLWMEKFLSTTNQLWCTGFNFTNNGKTVVGIEAQIYIHRQARIEDLVIQLVLNGNLVGNNYASTINPVQSNMYTGGGPNDVYPVPVGDLNVYGSSTDTWGHTFTSANIADSTFGIAVSYKSNVIYPHSDIAFLDQVSIRVTYA